MPLPEPAYARERSAAGLSQRPWSGLVGRHEGEDVEIIPDGRYRTGGKIHTVWQCPYGNRSWYKMPLGEHCRDSPDCPRLQDDCAAPDSYTQPLQSARPLYKFVF